jgi:hypothetical protein
LRNCYGRRRLCLGQCLGIPRLCHPKLGTPHEQEDNDYYYAFATYLKASAFAASHPGTEEPIALIQQMEWMDEPQSGEYRHVKQERITEWRVEFLRRPRPTPHTIPDFLCHSAPPNRLDVIRGLVTTIR